MGADALVGRPSKRQEIPITDSKVCKSYIVGTCPHDLFTNTKQDLGPCPKIHSEAHKAEYEREKEKAEQGERGKLSSRDLANFELEYFRDLEKYITDCNRRLDAAQRRLERTPDEIAQTTALVSHPLYYFYISIYLTQWDLGSNIQLNKNSLKRSMQSTNQ